MLAAFGQVSGGVAGRVGGARGSSGRCRAGSSVWSWPFGRHRRPVGDVSGRGGLSSAEVADRLGVSVNLVGQLARSGELPAVRVGRRWLFDEAVVAAWVDPQCDMGVRRERRSLKATPYRYMALDRRPHVELLESLGLSDEQLAAALGVSVAKVRRWHEFGIPNVCVGRVRRLAEKLRSAP